MEEEGGPGFKRLKAHPQYAEMVADTLRLQEEAKRIVAHPTEPKGPVETYPRPKGKRK